MNPEDDELRQLTERLQQVSMESHEAVRQLDPIRQAIQQSTLPISEALKQARNIEDDFETKIAQLHKKAFTVGAVDEHGNEVEGRPEPSKKLIDISIHMEDLPISEEKVNFGVDIDRTLKVIKLVLPISENRPRKFLSSFPGKRPSRALDQRSEYIVALRGICHVGLEHNDPSQLKAAKQSLVSLQEEFFAREAGKVKNGYLLRLGLICFVASATSCLGFVFAPDLFPSFIVRNYRNFFMLAAGSCVGTWLSFSLRRPILTFLDLAVLEEDLMDPPIRVAFVIALTTIVGLLFSTQAVTAALGGFDIAGFSSSGATALLIGLLLGIAERTMGPAVYKRATEFAGAIGGK